MEASPFVICTEYATHKSAIRVWNNFASGWGKWLYQGGADDGRWREL